MRGPPFERHWIRPIAHADELPRPAATGEQPAVAEQVRTARTARGSIRVGAARAQPGEQAAGRVRLRDPSQVGLQDRGAVDALRAGRRLELELSERRAVGEAARRPEPDLVGFRFPVHGAAEGGVELDAVRHRVVHDLHGRGVARLVQAQRRGRARAVHQALLCGETRDPDGPGGEVQLAAADPAQGRALGPQGGAAQADRLGEQAEEARVDVHLGVVQDDTQRRERHLPRRADLVRGLEPPREARVAAAARPGDRGVAVATHLVLARRIERRRGHGGDGAEQGRDQGSDSEPGAPAGRCEHASPPCASIAPPGGRRDGKWGAGVALGVTVLPRAR